MALRILSPMITAPLKTSLLGFANGMSGQGYPITLVRSKALMPIVRRFAVAASAAENSGGESRENTGSQNTGTNLARKQSNLPASRRQSGGLSRRGSGSGAIANPADFFFDIWDPFLPNRSLKQVLDTVDRLFDSSLIPATTSPALSNLRTPWDVMETDDAFKLRFDMPGLSKDEVKVTVEDGDLVIKGEHKREDGEHKTDDSWTARAYGSYYTRITLPENVKLDEIKAELKNGVLEVVVAKSKEAPKKDVVEINIE